MTIPSLDCILMCFHMGKKGMTVTPSWGISDHVLTSTHMYNIRACCPSHVFWGKTQLRNTFVQALTAWRDTHINIHIGTHLGQVFTDPGRMQVQAHASED